MLSLELLLVILIFLALLGLLLLVILILKNQLNKKDQIIQNLLNRLMSADLQTFQRLEQQTTLQNSQMEQIYSSISMSDAAEAERYNKLHGIGEPIFSEDPMSQQELNDMLMDLGLGVRDDRNS